MSTATPKPPPAIVVAHNLLARICGAAKTAGDTGREFLASNLLKLTGCEILFRRQRAAEATVVVDEIKKLDAQLHEFLENDGKIDRQEAERLFRTARLPRRHAAALAHHLDLPQ